MTQSQEALPQAAKQWMATYHHDGDDEDLAILWAELTDPLGRYVGDIHALTGEGDADIRARTDLILNALNAKAVVRPVLGSSSTRERE